MLNHKQTGVKSRSSSFEQRYLSNKLVEPHDAKTCLREILTRNK